MVQTDHWVFGFHCGYNSEPTVRFRTARVLAIFEDGQVVLLLDLTPCEGQQLVGWKRQMLTLLEQTK